ncbi:hypothetical protein SLS57_010546 [Botryosphaeria dothidea]
MSVAFHTEREVYEKLAQVDELKGWVPTFYQAGHTLDLSDAALRHRAAAYTAEVERTAADLSAGTPPTRQQYAAAAA